jgi:hypothetical protein
MRKQFFIEPVAYTPGSEDKLRLGEVGFNFGTQTIDV